MRRLLCVAAAAAVLVPGVTGGVTALATDEVVLDVLVFTETTGFRHASIADGVKHFERVAAEDGLDDVDVRVTVANDSSSVFTDAGLAPYDVVTWLSTTGNPLSTPEQAAFERFVQRGGGFVGVHAAADNEYTWPWYGDLVGAYFASHPAGTPKATIDVEDSDHASTDHLPARWTRNDEWYDYRRNPRKTVCNREPEVAGVVETQSLLEPVPGLPFPLAAAQGTDTGVPQQYDTRAQECSVHVLLTVDESTYKTTAPADHPIAWCHDFDGGRAFYTGLGHTSASWTEPEFQEHLLGGLLSAAGLADCGPA